LSAKLFLLIAAHALNDKIQPLTRLPPRELIYLLEFTTDVSYSINQTKTLSAEITHTIEDLQSRWPALNKLSLLKIKSKVARMRV
jgi:hypothetical protein